MHKSISLTAALEDYLEAIFNLSRFDKAARSRDIAEALSVHKSTVTAALRALGQMRLINYSPYEAVTLTQEGKKLAEDVVKRHETLKAFFTDVLKVDAEMAEVAACGMEHSVPREIVDRMAALGTFMRDCPRLAEEWHKSGCLEGCLSEARCRFGAVLDDGAAPAVTQEAASEKRDKRSSGKSGEQGMPQELTLDAVKPGNKARIQAITGDGPVKKRITEMGLTRGAVVQVERVAPLGDPIDIKVRGYHLSLRKEEASKVVVEEA